MEVTKLRVEGENTDRLVGLLRDRLPGCHAYTTDSIVVLVSEKFYFRIESNLLNVLILNAAGKSAYEVEIVTGGGAQGFFGITLGAERHRSGQIVKLLEEVCAANSWTLERRP